MTAQAAPSKYAKLSSAKASGFSNHAALSSSSAMSTTSWSSEPMQPNKPSHPGAPRLSGRKAKRALPPGDSLGFPALMKCWRFSQRVNGALKAVDQMLKSSNGQAVATVLMRPKNQLLFSVIFSELQGTLVMLSSIHAAAQELSSTQQQKTE